MKLEKVAQRFNHTPFSDSYSGEILGRGQLDVYDDNKRDGPTTQRRIFEVAPGVETPDRKIIQIHERNWLVGKETLDSFRGRVIRKKWILHEAEDLAGVFTVQELLEGEDPLYAYAARVWERAAAELEESSGQYNRLQIFFTDSEAIQADMIVRLAGKFHTVMTTYKASGGHLAAVSEEIERDPLETIEIEGTTWDPITEQYTGGMSAKLLRLRWQSDFSYYSQATETFQRGDMQAATMADVPVGAQLPLSDGAWRTVATQRRNSVNYLHLRRD